MVRKCDITRFVCVYVNFGVIIRRISALTKKNISQTKDKSGEKSKTHKRTKAFCPNRTTWILQENCNISWAYFGLEPHPGVSPSLRPKPGSHAEFTKANSESNYSELETDLSVA